MRQGLAEGRAAALAADDEYAEAEHVLEGVHGEQGLAVEAAAWDQIGLAPRGGQGAGGGLADGRDGGIRGEAPARQEGEGLLDGVSADEDRPGPRGCEQGTGGLRVAHREDGGGGQADGPPPGGLDQPAQGLRLARGAGHQDPDCRTARRGRSWSVR